MVTDYLFCLSRLSRFCCTSLHSFNIRNRNPNQIATSNSGNATESIGIHNAA